LKKCQSIANTDRTIVTENQITGVSTQGQTDAYTFDP